MHIGNHYDHQCRAPSINFYELGNNLSVSQKEVNENLRAFKSEYNENQTEMHPQCLLVVHFRILSTNSFSIYVQDEL